LKIVFGWELNIEGVVRWILMIIPSSKRFHEKSNRTSKDCICPFVSLGKEEEEIKYFYRL